MWLQIALVMSKTRRIKTGRPSKGIIHDADVIVRPSSAALLQRMLRLESSHKRLKKIVDELLEVQESDKSKLQELDEDNFNYDEMYRQHMIIANLTDVDVRKQGNLMSHIFWRILVKLFKRNESLMDIHMPSFMSDSRGLLEVFSDFIRPGLFVEIPQADTPEERMLRTLKFYLAGLSKMRGLEGMSKKPLGSVKGEVFRCMWKTAANRQDEIAGCQYQNWFGVAETYFVQQWKRKMLLKPRKIKELDAGQQSSAMKGNLHPFPPLGILPTNDKKMVHFLAEQVSSCPPVSTFYAECDFNQVFLHGTIETKAKLEWVCDLDTCCDCNFLDKVDVQSKGDITITLGDFQEDYVFTLPVNKVKKARSKPQVDFHDSIRITCVQTGYHCAIRFLPPSNGDDRFKIRAYMYSGNKGPLLYRVEGCWNGDMSVKKEDIDAPSALLFSAKDAFYETKIMTSIDEQEDYESRKIWKNVVRGIVAKRWHLADKHKEKVKLENKNNPMKIKYFQKSGTEYVVKRNTLTEA